MKDWIETYTRLYTEQLKIEKTRVDEEVENLLPLSPNEMQVSFTANLRKLIEKGGKKGLLISATGTGKTYASAFALRDLNAKRVLFIAHRSRILSQSLESYKRIFGNKISMGLLNGDNKDVNGKDFVFSTIMMLHKDEFLTRFKPDEFDYIVIDEVHKAGAASYLKVMNYFKPKFYLGMSATPERTDGFDIYSLFDHNIVYEIRLEQALEEKLLCPFHYFGIADFVDDKSEIRDLSDFKDLVSDKRVDYVIEKANYFGHSGDRVKGLIFVSSKEEGNELSRLFNERGFKTVFLSADDNEDYRDECIDKLETDGPNYLDYIFIIDIFNEGIDIPSVNQVIFLRPTQSPIIFVQQLGRGLRKFDNKDYVVIIDFIANYENNYLIPIALSGDKGKDKDSIRKYVASGNVIIPGCSSVQFDQISEKHIYNALDNAKINVVGAIKSEYFKVKNRVGRITTLFELDEFSNINVPTILSNNNIDSYYGFLIKYEPDFKVRLSVVAEIMLAFVSKKLIQGKRVYDLLLLRELVIEGKNSYNSFLAKLNLIYKESVDEHLRESLYNLLTNNFCISAVTKKNFNKAIFLEKDENGFIVGSSSFVNELENPDFKKLLLEELDFGIKEYEDNYRNHYKDTDLVLNKKYSYEDVCLLLRWKINVNGLNIGGYKFDDYSNTMPVFINYNKDPSIQESINYNDKFLSTTDVVSMSKSKRNLDSPDADRILNAKKNGTKIYLFMRKDKKDKGEEKFFYFLGEISVNPPLVMTKNKNNEDLFEITWRLDVPVSEDIYDYITKVSL